MTFSPKVVADNLIKIAEALEKEAAENSYFVCEGCNHTATLATINDRRIRVARERNVRNVNAVTVNDKVSCPACDGVMSYAPTEESAKYYIEAADRPVNITPPSDTPGTESAPLPPPAEKDITKKKIQSDPNSSFAPVDEQESEKLDLGFGDEDVEEPEEETYGAEPHMDTGILPEGKKKPERDKPKLGKRPEGESSMEDDLSVDEEEPLVVEDTVPEKGLDDMLPEPKKPGRKKKEKIDFPKADVPKFEKMPKEALDMDYQIAFRKYLF